MRLATACALLSLAAALPARAQTFPPEAYYPLDVGNVWIYTYDYDTGDGAPPVTRLDEITGTQTVRGIEYAVRRQCQVVPVGRNDCEPELVRIDESGDVVVLQPDGTELAERCALGAPDGTEILCPVGGGEPFPLTVSQSDGPTAVAIGYQLVEVEGGQTYGGSVDPPPSGFAVGIGPLAPTTFGGFSVFHYAYVAGVEYGLNPLGGPAWSYDPVAVGSVREYTVPDGPGQTLPRRVDSPRALVIDGETWTLRRSQTLLPPDDAGFRARAESRQLVRFDTLSAELRELYASGAEDSVYPCPLDAFDPIGGSCTAAVAIVQGLTEITRGDETRYAAVGTFDSVGGVTQLAGGLGLLFQIGDASSQGENLTYADIGPLPAGDPLPFGTPFGEAFPTEIDPTPAHLYYPLAVGNEWHYQYTTVGNPYGYTRRRIIGTQVVDGETYFISESSQALPAGNPPVWEVTGTNLVRFDTLSAQPASPEGLLGACPLDEPVNVDTGWNAEELVFCKVFDDSVPTGYYAVRSTSGSITQQGGLVVPTSSFKRFVWYYTCGGARCGGQNAEGGYAAGVGYVFKPGGSPFEYAALEYARVEQEDGSILTLGTPLPVGAEDGAPVAALTVAAAPNPTAGALRLAVTVPRAGALRAEAFDALGRLVWSHAGEAAAGPAELAVDAGAWAPGLYVVRVQTGDAVATTRVVRR